MRRPGQRSFAVLTCLLLVAALGPAARAGADDKPRAGGELLFIVAAEPHLAKVRGWSISPSHFLNQQLDTVWLAE